MTEREKLQRGTQRQDAVRRRFWGTTLPSIRLVNGYTKTFDAKNEEEHFHVQNSND